MSFFGKIKQGLGIGTAKVELEIPGQVQGSAGQIEGKVIITAKSDQVVKEVRIVLIEEYTTGRGDDKTSKQFELGTITLPGMELKAGETHTLSFQLPFQLLKSSNQSLSEEKGVLGALGKAAVFARNEKSEYKVKASLSLQGTMLNPDTDKSIHIL